MFLNFLRVQNCRKSGNLEQELIRSSRNMYNTFRYVCSMLFSLTEFEHLYQLTVNISRVSKVKRILKRLSMSVHAV